MSSNGNLSVTVWPVYVGFGHDPNENLSWDRRYQITWSTENKMVVGHANPVVDKGEYPFLLYFYAPYGPPCFSAKFDHAYRSAKLGRKHVGPIMYVNDQITAELSQDPVP